MYVAVTSTWWWPKVGETWIRWQLDVQRSDTCVHSENKYRHWLTTQNGMTIQKKIKITSVLKSSGHPGLVCW